MTDSAPAGPGYPRYERTVEARTDGVAAIDLLAEAAPISRQKLKQAMQKGGVWLCKAGGGRRRLRRAKTALHPGDRLELHYDAYILSREPPEPRLIADKGAYSVWFKPASMLSQGSKFADHCALTRWVEKYYTSVRAVYLVHRLDRAASGLMLLAHDQKTAAYLSGLFSSREITKRYRVTVKGRFAEPLPLRIDTRLDGKPAQTVVKSAHAGAEQSELVVEIQTGRKHQIRRHLSERGWPVRGDTRYGGAPAGASLQLSAEFLQFVCPVTSALVTYQL